MVTACSRLLCSCTISPNGRCTLAQPPLACWLSYVCVGASSWRRSDQVWQLQSGAFTSEGSAALLKVCREIAASCLMETWRQRLRMETQRLETRVFCRATTRSLGAPSVWLLRLVYFAGGRYPEEGTWSERCSLAQEYAKSCTEKLGGCTRGHSAKDLESPRVC